MKFEEALKAMREGKKVKRGSGEYCYYIKNNILYHENSKGEVDIFDDNCCCIAVGALFSDDFVVVDEGVIKENKADKIDIKITFIDGGEIVIPDDLWDDYRYDGKFFTVVQDGIDIAMYNATKVFSLVLVKHPEKTD